MIIKRLHDDSLQIMDNLKPLDNFKWATIILSTSSANLASRNESLSFSRPTITLFTSVANLALCNDSLSFSWATINLPTSDSNLVVHNDSF